MEAEKSLENITEFWRSIHALHCYQLGRKGDITSALPYITISPSTQYFVAGALSAGKAQSLEELYMIMELEGQTPVIDDQTMADAIRSQNKESIRVAARYFEDVERPSYFTPSWLGALNFEDLRKSLIESARYYVTECGGLIHPYWFNRFQQAGDLGSLKTLVEIGGEPNPALILDALMDDQDDIVQYLIVEADIDPRMALWAFNRKFDVLKKAMLDARLKDGPQKTRWDLLGV